jgi:hypothetical protein
MANGASACKKRLICILFFQGEQYANKKNVRVVLPVFYLRLFIDRPDGSQKANR